MEHTPPARIPDGTAWRAKQGIRHEPKAIFGARPISQSIVASGTLLRGDQALAIAQTDAMAFYRDLSVYRILLVLESDGWHIDYELKDPKQKGGGPHYVIDAVSGAILAKRFEQ